MHKSSIEVLPLNLALNPPFCQTDVIASGFVGCPCKPLSILSFCVIERWLCVAFFIFFEAFENF